MEELDIKYLSKLHAVRDEIQNSDILARYLDEEEEEIFKELQAAFEPRLNELHAEVAGTDPLQLIAFETELTDPMYEGLFLPRVLGYAVMRAEINDQYKYTRPQDHFKDLLLAICNSANFDVLKLRTGQSIKVGFALSSNIWITNLINLTSNKRVISFLSTLNLEKYGDIRDRRTAYVKYQKQFQNFNFQTADFPSDLTELKLFNSSLKTFLIYRANSEFDNSSLNKYIHTLLENESLVNSDEYLELLMVLGMSFNLPAETSNLLMSNFQKLRSSLPDFKNKYFTILSNLLTDTAMDLSSEKEQRFAGLIDRSVDDEITRYYNLVEKVHGLGYVHEDAIEAVRNYYDQHQGLSIENTCVRQVIFKSVHKLMTNLNEESYQDYFEMNKVFVNYMNIFSNERFNQDVKGVSQLYVKKLLKKYTDKRGRDYQDIKKFVSTTFEDLGFMKPKEIVEMFKTRRKKKTA